MSKLLPLLLFFLLLLSTLAASLNFQTALTHVHSDKNLTKIQIIKRTLRRDRRRTFVLQMLQSITSESKASASDFQARIHADSGNYAINVTVGDPPVPFQAIMDTGSDLIWTQCATNSTAADKHYYDPAKSSTSANISCTDALCRALPKPRCAARACEYSYGYGDGSSSEGFLARDALGFGAGPGGRAPPVGFGCGMVSRGQGLETGRGVIGLGRGNLSLVAQLGIAKFAYCLSSIGTQSIPGVFAVGSQAARIADAARNRSFSTALIKNPSSPTFYYVSLEGISVGGTRLPIPRETFQMGADGSGGVVVDSGTTLTMISEDAYNLVKGAFITQTKLDVRGGGQYDYNLVNDMDVTGLDLCFDLGNRTVADAERVIPVLTFHFTGMDLDLKVENYMVADLQEKQMCLAMAPSGVLSILGNIQQQNMVMLHDLQKGTLSMIPADCQAL